LPYCGAVGAVAHDRYPPPSNFVAYPVIARTRRSSRWSIVCDAISEKVEGLAVARHGVNTPA
jgi:hypothetical protein